MREYQPLSAKLRATVFNAEGTITGVNWYCPGCKIRHGIATDGPPGTERPIWGWNRNADAPTFTPSILVTREMGEPPVTSENLEEYKRKPWPQTKVKQICHSFITDGQIQFLSDCTHALAGQTVPMPDWDSV